MIILMVVVLPAPFGPRRPKNSPWFTEKEMSFTALTSPKCLLSERTSSAGIAGHIATCHLKRS